MCGDFTKALKMKPAANEVKPGNVEAVNDDVITHALRYLIINTPISSSAEQMFQIERPLPALYQSTVNGIPSKINSLTLICERIN